jgi:hypothetical protein
MSGKLAIHDISYIINKFRLRTVEDFKDYGFRLHYRGKGCSRKVYSIHGYPHLVVKLLLSSERSAKRHALNEYKAYKRLTNRRVKKYRKLWRYVPKIYSCSKDGVILMKRYKPCDYRRRVKEINVMRNLACYFFPENDGLDVYGDNVGRDEKDRLVYLDLGCFFSW